MENQRVIVVLRPQYWTPRMTVKPYIAALFAALALLTVNQGVAGSSPASGARYQELTAVAEGDASKTAGVVQYSDGQRHQLGAGLTFTELFSFVGEAGESMDDFALRVSPHLRSYSDKTRYEACGAIATDGDRYGVVIGTSGSHVGCAVPHSVTPDGMRSTGIAIHSHGAEGQSRINKADRLFLGNRVASNTRWVAGQRLDEFSHTDYGEPGYLATPTGARYQEGRGTSRVVQPSLAAR